MIVFKLPSTDERWLPPGKVHAGYELRFKKNGTVQKVTIFK